MRMYVPNILLNKGDQMIYNLKHQSIDRRDYQLLYQKVDGLPSRVDLRKDCPPVFNQADLGSCSSQAGVAARMMVGDIDTMLSRLYLYYKEREMNNETSEDSGATMRDVCKALAKFGVCEEQIWPYVVKKFDKAPPVEASLNAEKYKIIRYSALHGTDAIRNYLAIHQQPVLIGMDVYSCFESKEVKDTGNLPLPGKFEQYLGGHAILIVGYDDNKLAAKKRGLISWIKQLFSGKERLEQMKTGCFICRNSWGKDWGDGGYFYMPYDYVNNGLAFDAWVISDD